MPLVSRRLIDGSLIAFLALASLFLAARVGLTPRDPASGVGVIFAPWTSEQSAMARATDPGARFVRYGGLPFIVVVVPETSDYLARVYAAGALLIVDPQALAACLSWVGREIRS